MLLDGHVVAVERGEDHEGEVRAQNEGRVDLPVGRRFGRDLHRIVRIIYIHIIRSIVFCICIGSVLIYIYRIV